MAVKTLAERHGTVKAYAAVLILHSTGLDPDGRRIGYSYQKILCRLKKAFPTITYSGPHKGCAIRMTVKQLREIAYTMQSEDREMRMPVRPRSTRKKKDGKRKRVTTAQPKAALGPRAITAPPKG